jgi:peptidylprolyl isomerase
MKRSLVLFVTLVIASASIAATPTAPPRPEPPANLGNPPAEAEKLDDGLITVKLSDGTGTEHPADGDIVSVRFSIWKPDGTLVENVGGAKAAAMSLSRMMPGWREAVSKMVTGEQRRTWIPSSLGGGKIAEDSTFIIDTELVAIIHGPKTPEDVAAPPADAEATRSGLAWRVLKAGSGTRHPSRRSTVVVNYSGWTTDGRMFDSTVLHGKPAEFPLDKVIAGWTEGIPMMTEGEVRRFWIPAKLAYADQPERPQGMLVFDVELLGIK